LAVRATYALHGLGLFPCRGASSDQGLISHAVLCQQVRIAG
jgi:hypothetical protein